jgi:protein gp37
MAQSAIEWTEMTWNPTTGCNKVSAGCKFWVVTRCRLGVSFVMRKGCPNA